jgi:predicted HTH domain antitoxin
MTNSVITLETQIPDDVYATLKAQGFLQEQLAAESKRLLALHFFREHVLSLGQAARLAGMDYWSFTEFLSVNNVPVVDLDEKELSDELSTVKRIAQQIEEGQE